MTGDKGLPGDKGKQGKQGNQGDKGRQGNQGNRGNRGNRGQGGVGDKGRVGDKGVHGDQGERGLKGQVGSIRSTVLIVVLLAVIPGATLSVAADVNRYDDAKAICISGNVARSVTYDFIGSAEKARTNAAKYGTNPNLIASDAKAAEMYAEYQQRIEDSVAEFPVEGEPAHRNCGKAVTKPFPINLFY